MKITFVTRHEGEAIYADGELVDYSYVDAVPAYDFIQWLVMQEFTHFTFEQFSTGANEFPRLLADLKKDPV